MKCRPALPQEPTVLPALGNLVGKAKLPAGEIRTMTAMISKQKNCHLLKINNGPFTF